MKIRAQFIGWNIQDTIALTINHYKSFCDQVVFWDNYSTDRSAEIAHSLGAVVRPFGVPGVLDDGEYLKVKNNCWKGSDFDYEIACDDDEILYHPNLSFVLEQEKAIGTTIFKTQGYGMFSESVPRETFLETVTGIPDENYSKWVIFDPSAIKEMNYVYGCHVAKPSGNLIWGQTTIPLLHYMAIGGAERMIKRHAAYAKRLSPLNQRWGLGHEYTHTPESKRQWFAEQLKKSAPLSEVGLS